MLKSHLKPGCCSCWPGGCSIKTQQSQTSMVFYSDARPPRLMPSLKAKRRMAGELSRESKGSFPWRGLSVLRAQLLNQFLQRSQLPPVDQVEFLVGGKCNTKSRAVVTQPVQTPREPPNCGTAAATACVSAEKFKHLINLFLWCCCSTPESLAVTK